MPELPEVETIRRVLEPHLRHARILAVWTSGIPLHLLRPVDEDALRAACAARRIDDVRRRGKYLLVDTDGGHVVVVHLGMTGQLRVVSASDPRAPHTHVIWTLDKGRELRFVDPRRFGQVKVALRAREDDLPDLGQLGIDPLSRSMTTDALLALTQASRRPVKTFLLDQTRVAGIGNIYACEALYRACIHPGIPANRLRRDVVERLRRAIVEVLRSGLRNRGTTLRDYVDADGERGRNQHALDVYGREGKACRRCGRAVKRLTHEARGTFFCPGCQKR